MRDKTVVIVGAGLAGAKAAEALRDEGFDGRVVLVGDEPERPYERPPLSKEYLQGKSSRDDVYVHPADFYDEHGIELWTQTRIDEVDSESREVVVAGGKRLRFDRLLLATGAEPRRLAIDGAALPGVHYLRELHDADRLRETFARGGKLVVVGAGWIGAEVAASARQLGLDVTIVEPAPAMLLRALGRELGDFYARLHRENGVDLRLGILPVRFDGDERLEAIELEDGTRIACDVALIGIGVVPRTELAERAGILVANGIVATRQLETSVPGIFAAGDVVSAQHPFYNRRVRVEHWANALNQPAVAARAMVGKPASYDELPYFYSDQYDVGMEFIGDPTGSDELVFRGYPQEREFIAFWLTQSRVVAGMNVNVWDVVDNVKALIQSRAPIDKRALTDLGRSLGDLVTTEVVAR